MSRDTAGLDRPYKPTQRRKRDSQKPGTIVAEYCCPFCPFVTWTGPAALSCHLRSHLGTQHCPACGVSAASKPALHQHIVRRHIHPDKDHHADEPFLDEVPDACLGLIFCEACRLVAHYNRRVLGHCCFLCDYSDANPLDLYRHVMMGHVQIAKSREINIAKSCQTSIATARETNKPGMKKEANKLSTGVDDFVSQVEDGGHSVHLKSEEEGERQRSDGQRTPPKEPQRCGKRKSPPVSPLTVEHTHVSSPAFSVEKECVDVTVPPMKRRKIFRDSGNNRNCLVRTDAFSETTTTSQKDSKESEGLLPASERRIPVLNTEAVMSRATYNVGFRSVWVPIISPSPPVLEQEVPLDLSLRKAQAPPTDKTESTMPVITSVFSWKDYI